MLPPYPVPVPYLAWARTPQKARGIWTQSCKGWYVPHHSAPHFHAFFLLCPVADREYIRDVKERCCYVTLDFDKQKVQANDPPSCPKELQLPDGQKISLGEGAFTCPEALFQTNLIGEFTIRGQMSVQHQQRSAGSKRRWWVARKEAWFE